MYVATIKMFKLQRTKVQNIPSEVYISETPVTLQQSQGHEAYNDNVYPNQGYNHAKFKNFYTNGVREKAIIKVFFSNEEVC